MMSESEINEELDWFGYRVAYLEDKYPSRNYGNIYEWCLWMLELRGQSEEQVVNELERLLSRNPIKRLFSGYHGNTRLRRVLLICHVLQLEKLTDDPVIGYNLIRRTKKLKDVLK